MSNIDEAKILKILQTIDSKNFLSIEELKDSFYNAYDDIIEKLFKQGYLNNKSVYLTYKGRNYMEKLQKTIEEKKKL